MSGDGAEGQISEDVVEETPAEEPVETPADPVVEDPGDEDDLAAETPAYEPNYKFKVHGEEKEMEDWAKSLVKSPEDEQKFREIHEKIYGLEHIKADREQLRGQLEPLQETSVKYQQLSQNLDALSQHINQGNYDAFFQALKIPENEVMGWAAKRLQYAEMDPAQRAEYDASVAARANSVHLQQQAQSMEQQLHQIQHQQRMFELDQQIVRPDVAEHARTYNERMGDPEAFKIAVRDRGLYHAKVHGTDVPVEQAVAEVLAMMGVKMGEQGVAPAVQPATAQSQVPTQPVAPAKKPVIPNVEGSGLSAVQAAPRSISDLRKLANARAGVN